MASLRLLLIVLALASVLAPDRARADASPRFDFSGIYLPVGVDVGVALRSRGKNGLLLGGEASAFYLWHDKGLTFVGGYAGYQRDFGLDVHRISFGPEAGTHFVARCRPRDRIRRRRDRARGAGPGLRIPVHLRLVRGRDVSADHRGSALVDRGGAAAQVPPGQQQQRSQRLGGGILIGCFRDPLGYGQATANRLAQPRPSRDNRRP
jgi:hypothetical protein